MSRNDVLTLSIASPSQLDLRSSLNAASPLYSCVPSGGPLFSDLPHPPYFYSNSIQTFQGARPFPLCRTEVSFSTTSPSKISVPPI